MTRKHRILMVGDYAPNRRKVSILFERDYDLFEADSGESALQAVRDFAPDMVLLDSMQPGMDGLEVCRHLRAEGVSPSLKILLISAGTGLSDRLAGYQAGADDYLTRPFEDEELAAKVRVFSRLIDVEQRCHDAESALRDRVRLDWETRLETINRELQTLLETGAMVASVAHDAKQFTSAMSLALEGLVIPRLTEKLDQSVDWVMDLMNDIIEIHANANQCSAFLESLLAINQKNEDIGPVSSVDLVKQAIGLLSYNLMQEGVHWRLDFAYGRQWMVMGNAQLIQVFMNLIANAADTLRKHQVENPEIVIRIEADGEDFVRVSVQDNGPGIQPALLDTIRKGIDTSAGVRGGGGFGISGASRIIKVCDGRMMVESQPGQGAVFSVALPKAPDEATAEIDLDGVELF